MNKFGKSTIMLLVLIFAGGAVFGTDLTIPNTFTAGTKAMAAEVNENFSAVEAAVDDNDTRLDAVVVGPFTFDYVPSFNGGVSAFGPLNLINPKTKALASLYFSGDKSYISADVMNFRVPNPADGGETEIVYAAVEGPEAAAYVRGTARLEKGKALIELPSHFIGVAIEEGMTVQLTPLHAESKGLAVVKKSLVNGIAVQELFGGSGTYDFDYHVTAIRQGYEKYEVIQEPLGIPK